MSFTKKILHVRLSWRAIAAMWRDELSFKMQALFAVLVFLASFVLRISPLELAVVICMIGAVLATEALNTAIEEICDHMTSESHPRIAKIKDLGSGASLLIGIAALAVGLIIFVPHLTAFFG